MAKRRHRSKNDFNENMPNMNNNPFGIDPNQLMDMMGNLDMNKVNNLMDSMSKDGIDLGDLQNTMQNNNNNNNGNNNMDPMQMFNNMPNMNNGMGNFNPMALLSQLGNFNGGMNNRNNNNNSNNNSNNVNRNNVKPQGGNVRPSSNIKRPNMEKKKVRIDDANIEMLLALKKIVNEERGGFIDKVIQKYNEGIFD